jgi:hypothetical protein
MVTEVSAKVNRPANLSVSRTATPSWKIGLGVECQNFFDHLVANDVRCGEGDETDP